MFDGDSSDVCTIAPQRFENAEWRVLADGLEHRATGYFIDRETIAMRRGDLWEWPLHLAEKTWCTPRSFQQAFLAAVDAFGVAADASLARSFAVAFGVVAGPRARPAATADAEDFVALGDLVRPKPASPVPARMRNGVSEARAASRRAGVPMPQRMQDSGRQRAAL